MIKDKTDLDLARDITKSFKAQISNWSKDGYDGYIPLVEYGQVFPEMAKNTERYIVYQPWLR